MGIIRKLKNIYHLLRAFLANSMYGFPSRKLTVIGVTGTDGKTTTTHLIYHILKHAGKSVSMSSTVFADIAGVEKDTGLHVTTQSSFSVQKNIRDAVKNGSEIFVLETTSHGIDQHRVWGVSFDYAVLTNITPEHLDYHKTFENYRRTKMSLLLGAKHAILNVGDPSYVQNITDIENANVPHTTYGLGKDADVRWKSDIKTVLQEDFNKENILAAIAVCEKIGLKRKEILQGIETFTLPKGRYDIVYNKRFKVIIDFAHTSNSIESLLSQFADKSGRIIHVFGCAGLRDKEKRAIMGKSSGKYADITILTEEDYRTEDFQKITNAISSGLYEANSTYLEPHVFENEVIKQKTFTIIKNRQEAIQAAINKAKTHDVVIITGKGHEQSLARGTNEYPWDEYKAVEKALQNKS